MAAARWYQHGYHTVFAHKLVFGTIPYLPRLLHPPIAVITAAIFFLLLRKERQAVARNFGRVLGRPGPAPLRKAYRVFYSFCDFIVSYCFVPRASHLGLLRMLAAPDHGAELVRGLLAEGNGLLVWTAHLGNWEFASRLLELHGRTVHVARVVERGNRAEMMLREMMTGERLKVVQLNDNSAAPIELLHALRNGDIVAMQGDRVYHGFSAATDFFGARAEFPLGPFLLAWAAGAPVLPGVVVRKRWLRYRVVFGEPIMVNQTGDRDRDLRCALEKAVRFLEDAVREYPDQWMNFYDFWPERQA